MFSISNTILLQLNYCYEKNANVNIMFTFISFEKKNTNEIFMTNIMQLFKKNLYILNRINIDFKMRLFKTQNT